MKKLNIIVTGVGGDIGFSIGKILKEVSFVGKLIGTDIHSKHASFLFFDFVEEINKADSNVYIEDLKNLIKKYNVDLIIPTSEYELRFLNRNSILEINQIPILLPNKLALDVGFDKYKTNQFLKKCNLPFPRTILGNDGSEVIVPSVYKSREGSGSSSVSVIQDEEEFAYYLKKNDKRFIFQEYLKDDNNEEFTCGVYRFSDGLIKTVIISRELNSAGVTVYGESINNKIIETFLVKLARLIDLRGSINVQLKMVNDIPYVFEINPRFSSTVRFRHMIGFQDLIWDIQETLAIIPTFNRKEIKIETSKKYFRFYDEVII